MVATVMPLSGQEPIPLTRLKGPVVFDGVPDEPAWEGVPAFPMTVFTPTFGARPTERTEIMVAYDDSHLYVGGRLYDSEPQNVRTNTLYRDQYSGDDLMAIVLDSYNDHETAVWFTVNPAGVRIDRTVSNDGEFSNGMPMNESWNSFWDVATAQTGQGWFAEMRIPFSSLGFQDDNGTVVMGMIVYRYIARRNERQIFPAIPPNWGLAFAKPSKAQRVSLSGVYKRTPVYLTPYALGGLGRASEFDSVGNTHAFDHDVTHEVGLDVKYAPTNNLTVDLTVNTDFAQVEVDDQQVNLTRFSLFFPEKRQFFQERSSIFEFNTGGLSRLFHSRRIGLNDDEPVRILGGARLVGRIGKTDLGFLDMQTASERGLPAENFGVLRLRRSVFNPFSNVGGMVTTRVGDDGTYNVAFGVDASIRPLGDEYLTFKWAQSTESGQAISDVVESGRLLVGWERRNESGLGYQFNYARSGSRYDPGVGFTLRDDFTYAHNTLQYRWFFGETSPFRSFGVGNEISGYFRNTDRTVESASVMPQFELELKNGGQIRLIGTSSYESVTETFELPDGPEIFPGSYWFHEAELRFMAPRGAVRRGEFSITGGSFYDGWRVAARVSPTWNVSRHLELQASYQVDIVRFRERDEEWNSHLARLRAQVALNTQLSLSSFLQYNSTSDEASVNARVRYNFSEGNDLWIVYNEGFNTERNVVGQPRLPLSDNRALMVKYTYTFVR